jgi:hypothetical protein
MVLRDVRKGIAVLFSMAVLSFSVTGCGGGSSSDAGADAPVESKLVTITEENSEQVIDAVFGSMDIGDGFENVPSFKSVASVQSVPMLKSTEIPALKKVLSSSRNLNTVAESGTVECSGGGSYSYNGSKTSATFTFNSCTESGITMDGTLALTTNNEGTSGTLTYTNFSITQDENNKVVYSSATATFSFNDNYDVVDMSITINGYVVASGERTDFDNYRLILAMDNNYNMSITINGSIKSDCIGGWVEITTNEAMVGNAYDDCPSAGQIVISGNASSLTVTFNADGSVDVSGAVTNHYDSCNDLDTGACST